MKRIHEAILLCVEVEGNDYRTPDFIGVQRIAL
jgi:hypothetical protein